MRNLGCLFGQGYFFARPMPESDLLAGFRAATAAQPAQAATTSGRREANGTAALAPRRPASSKDGTPTRQRAPRRSPALRPASS
jgi:hypothetical protein